MDNIIQFPTKIARTNTVAENTLRHILERSGATKDAEDAIMAKITEYIKEYISVPFDTQFTSDLLSDLSDEQASRLVHDVSAYTDNIAEKVHKFTTEIVMERLMLEIKLYYENK